MNSGLRFVRNNSTETNIHLSRKCGSLIEQRTRSHWPPRLRVYHMSRATLTPLSERVHVIRNEHNERVKGVRDEIFDSRLYRHLSAAM